MRGAPGTSRGGIGRSAAVLGGILFSIGAGFLYQKLTALQVGKGVFTYSLSYTIPVVVCAAAAYLIVALRLIRVFGNRDGTIEEDVPEAEEAEEYFPEEEFDEAEPLLEDTQTIPEVTAAQQRAERIASALAAQRAAALDLPAQEENASEESDEWDALYKVPDSMEVNAAIREMYAELPEELPPGYTLPPELSEEEEESLEEEIEEEEPQARSPLRELLPAICAVAAFAVVFVLASSFWTKAGEDGIWIARMGKVRQYRWDQVASYTVDAGFSGGELVLEFQMEDGRQVKIAPASYVQTNEFVKQYENLYQYWLHIDNVLRTQGTNKTVSRAEYLADTYSTREDGSWQYVQQIIDYEEEPPNLLQ
ncbi:MAG: hypothetical protein KHW59_08080 [Clostridiales bacterium]|nr:hypothetical protein [Clostridiales bacterium]